MKTISGKVLLSALGALTAPVFLASAAAAQPAPKPKAADVKFSYDAPQISSDGAHVTWRWKLTNNGPGTADGVVLVHALTPPLKITKLAKECQETKAGISCSYGAIKDGGKKEGKLDAELSPDLSGTVEINGRVTWQQGTAKPEGSYSETVPIEPAPADAEAPAAPEAPEAPSAPEAPEMQPMPETEPAPAEQEEEPAEQPAEQPAEKPAAEQPA